MTPNSTSNQIKETLLVTQDIYHLLLAGLVADKGREELVLKKLTKMETLAMKEKDLDLAKRIKETINYIKNI